MTATVFLIVVFLGVLTCALLPKLRHRRRATLTVDGRVLMRQEVTREVLRNLAEHAGVAWTHDMTARELMRAIKQSISETESRCERAEDALWQLLGLSMGSALPPRPPNFDADAAARQISRQWPRRAQA